MRLKIDKRANKTKYLTKDAYEEEKYKKRPRIDSSVVIPGLITPNLNSLATLHAFSEVSPTRFTEDGQFTVSSKTDLDASEVQLHREVSEFSTGAQAEETKEPVTAEGETKLITSEEVNKKIEVNQFYLEQTKRKQPIEKKVMKCERITVKGAIWGELEFTENYLTFYPLEEERPEIEEYAMGTLKRSFIPSQIKKQWSFQKIKKLFKRRYNFIRGAFEILTSDNKFYYFNLLSAAALEKAIQEFGHRSKGLEVHGPETFRQTKYTEKWQEGKISNFEYLMQLNLFAGRSYNDLTQYPVFPWILADYTSKELNLHTRDEKEQKRIFRDLSYPIGALNEDRHEYLRGKIMLEDFEEQKKKIEASDCGDFMYGSHYSTGGHIIDYLVRVEPFTSLQISLQGGKFDDPNRIFSSIPKAWATYFSPNNTQNFKELVPEFFYDANFLKNRFFRFLDGPHHWFIEMRSISERISV